MAIEQQIRITADASQARRETSQFSSGMAKSMASAQVAVAALQKVWGTFSAQIKAGVDAAIEYEATNLKLTTALRSAGLEAEKNARAFNAQSSALELLAGISDENIRSMQALALNMTGSAETTEKLIPAAIKLSNAFGISLESAVRNLAKTTGGLAGELGELSPEIKNLTTEQLAAGEAIDIVNDRFEDQLGLLQQGMAGDINRLSNAWDALAENIALAATSAETFNKAIRGLTGALEALSAVKPTTLTEFLVTSIVGARAGPLPADLLTGQTSDGSEFDFRGKGGAGGGVVGPLGKGVNKFAGGGAEVGKLVSDALEFGPGTAEGAMGASLQDAQVAAQARSAELSKTIREQELEDLDDWQMRFQDKSADHWDMVSSIQEASLRRQQETLEAFASAGMQMFSSFSMGLVDVLIENEKISQRINEAMAAGDEKLAESLKATQRNLGRELVKSFLESTGKQLIADGTKNVFFGAVGLNPVLAGQGAAEIAAGGAMVAGSLAVSLPSGQSVGSASGAGAGGSFSRTSGPEQTRFQREININVFGKPTADLGRFVRDSMRESSVRGV